MELNKENLYNEYIINHKTQEECAELFHCSKWQVIRKAKEYGFKKTNIDNYNISNSDFAIRFQEKLGDEYTYTGEYINSNSIITICHKVCNRCYDRRTRQISSNNFDCPYCKKEKHISKNELKRLYIDENLDVCEICEKLGYHKTVIYKYIKKYDLQKNEIQSMACKLKEKQRRSDAKKKYYFNKDKVLNLLQDGKTLREMAGIFNCSRSAIGLYINNYHLSEYRNLDVINSNKKEVLKASLLEKYGVTNVMYVDEFKQKSFENKSKYVISKPEIALREYIKSIYDGEVTRYHDGMYELDIYIPEKNVGIEYNGNYWHTTEHHSKTYHYDKSKHFEEKGIRVIHVFEYEWENPRQKPILKNIIKNALGINQSKIYARKCKIEIRKSRDMKEFFDNNNIQGFRGGKFAICLTYNDEIVMAYMMGHCYFGKGKYQWEVIRGATKLGVTVVGGASKIWNYFINTYQPDNCVYYIDYNYFNGNSLPYLGLTYIKTQPGFKNYWKKEKKVKNREPKRHKEITRLYELGEVVPIYNAGTKVYVWHKS